MLTLLLKIKKGTEMFTKAMINKQQRVEIQKDTVHVCFHCLQTRKSGTWRMVGNLPIGDLWICEDCWDESIDLAADQTGLEMQTNPQAK